MPIIEDGKGERNSEPQNRIAEQHQSPSLPRGDLTHEGVSGSPPDSKQQHGKNRTYNGLDIATFGFVVLTTGGIFWQATILNESDHAIQKSAVAAKDAADAARKAVELSDKTAERQLRAYLSVDHGPWQQYPPQAVNSAPQYGAEFLIKHSGATPAYNVRIDATIEVAPRVLNQTKLYSPVGQGGGGVVHRRYAVLTGNNPIQLTIARPFEADAMRLTTTTDPLLGDNRFYMHGIVRYTDIFGLDNGGHEREYSFCFVFHPERQPDGTEQGCEDYNKPG